MNEQAGTYAVRESFQRLDGGWSTVEVTLPIEASPQEVQEAVERALATRVLLLDTLGAAIQQPATTLETDNDPAHLRLSFGKHQGKTLGELIDTEPDYLTWLAHNAREGRVRDAALALLPPSPAAGRGG